MKKLLQNIPARLRNRYGAVVLGLLAWVALFDRNDLWTTWKNHRELAKMEEQQEWFTAEIQRTKEQLHELSSDTELLEKFARERYLARPVASAPPKRTEVSRDHPPKARSKRMVPDLLSARQPVGDHTFVIGINGDVRPRRGRGRGPVPLRWPRVRR